MNILLHLALLFIAGLHVWVAAVRPSHQGVAKAIGVYVAAAWSAWLLSPEASTTAMAATLICPASFVWGIWTSYGLVSAAPIWVGIVLSLAIDVTRRTAPAVYPSALLLAWSVLTIFAWAIVIARHRRRPHGITFVAATMLAASLVADLPGLLYWASRGEYGSERALSVLSLASLGILPGLWKLVRCSQSQSDPACSQAGSPRASGSGIATIKS